jgi:hypothetical protein
MRIIKNQIEKEKTNLQKKILFLLFIYLGVFIFKMK